MSDDFGTLGYKYEERMEVENPIFYDIYSLARVLMDILKQCEIEDSQKRTIEDIIREKIL